ncbi:MAG: LacI family DNA-binding transcriptional regulator [Butyricicoccus pullicaecorum]
MAVTAQQIAELAGVSRGTVDRALHNRGRVNPEVAARIFRIATELGYKPNLIGQALVRTKRDFKIGAILQSAETPTMKIVLEGLKQAVDELRASGVEVVIRELRGLMRNFCWKASKNWSYRACRTGDFAQQHARIASVHRPARPAKYPGCHV